MTNVQLHLQCRYRVSYWKWLRLGKTWVIAGARNSFFIISLRARFRREKVCVNLLTFLQSGRLSSGNAWILKARTAQKSKVSGEIFLHAANLFPFSFRALKSLFLRIPAAKPRKKPDLRSSAIKRAALKRKTSRAGMLNFCFDPSARGRKIFWGLLQISSNR